MENNQHSCFLLTTDNYAIWVIPMESKLAEIDALDVVTGLITEAVAEDIDAKTKIKKLNQQAYIQIIQNVDASNLALVSTTLPANECFNGFALWTLLRNKYAGNDLVARSVALDHFLDLEYSLVATFTAAIRLANQKMVLAGVCLDDQVKMMLMLRKLPRAEFSSFRDIVAMGFSTESFEAIVKRLENYTTTNKVKKENDEVQYVQSMYTNHTHQCQPSSTNNAVCPHCNQPGHRPTNCWKKYPEKAPKHGGVNRAHFTQHIDLNDPTSMPHYHM